MPQFDVSTFGPQLIWLGVLFFLLYRVVCRWVVPRFEAIQHQRKQALATLIQRAEHAYEEAKSIEQGVAQRLLEADLENRRLTEEHLRTLEARLQDQDHAHAAHTRYLYKESEARILEANQRLLDNLGDIVTPLAVAAASRLTGETISPRDVGGDRGSLS